MSHAGIAAIPQMRAASIHDLSRTLEEPDAEDAWSFQSGEDDLPELPALRAAEADEYDWAARNLDRWADRRVRA